MPPSARKRPSREQLLKFREVLTEVLEQLECTTGQTTAIRAAIDTINYALGEPPTPE